MGPILFNIFLNDLLSSVSCNIDCYGDDSTLTKQGNSSDLVSTDLTSNCNIVSSWMAGNQSVLNADKTHLMLMSTSLKIVVPLPLASCLGFLSIEQILFVISLGVLHGPVPASGATEDYLSLYIYLSIYLSH